MRIFSGVIFLFVTLFVVALKVIVMWKVRLFCEVILVMLMLLLLVVMVIVIVMVIVNVESEDIQWSDCGGNATMVLMLGPRHR